MENTSPTPPPGKKPPAEDPIPYRAPSQPEPASEKHEPAVEDPDNDEPEIKEPDDLPDVEADLPELKIYSHSPIFYWWPVWVAGYALAIVSGISGESVRVNGPETQLILPSSNPGVFFVAVLLTVVIFTNVKLRGIYSVTVVLAIGLIAVVLAWMGWWDDIFGILPSLSVYMSMGFYLLVSTALLIVWLLAFFVFDRLTYWRIRPGQMTEERLIGGGERSYDTRGMLFEKRGEDVFRHVVLGIGAGDLQISTTGAREEELYIPNVLFVDRKVSAIQRLISIQPDDLLDATKPG